MHILIDFLFLYNNTKLFTTNSWYARIITINVIIVLHYSNYLIYGKLNDTLSLNWINSIVCTIITLYL